MDLSLDVVDRILVKVKRQCAGLGGHKAKVDNLFFFVPLAFGRQRHTALWVLEHSDVFGTKLMVLGGGRPVAIDEDGEVLAPSIDVKGQRLVHGANVEHHCLGNVPRYLAACEVLLG